MRSNNFSFSFSSNTRDISMTYSKSLSLSWSSLIYFQVVRIIWLFWTHSEFFSSSSCLSCWFSPLSDNLRLLLPPELRMSERRYWSYLLSSFTCLSQTLDLQLAFSTSCSKCLIFFYFIIALLYIDCYIFILQILNHI